MSQADSSLYSSQSFLESAYSPAIFGIMVGLYDFMIEKKNITKCMYDSGIMAGSLYASKIAHSVIDLRLIDTFGNQMIQEYSKYIVQPAINYFLYPYLYNWFYEGKFGNFTNNRSQTMSQIIGSASAFAQTMSDNYIVSFITGNLNL